MIAVVTRAMVVLVRMLKVIAKDVAVTILIMMIVIKMRMIVV